MNADSIETLDAYEICMWKIISIGLSKTNKILFHHIFCDLCSKSERLENFADCIIIVWIYETKKLPFRFFKVNIENYVISGNW